MDKANNPQLELDEPHQGIPVSCEVAAEYPQIE